MKIKIIDSVRIAIIVIAAVITFPIQGLAKNIANLPLTIEKASKGESSSQSDLVDYYYNTAKNYNEAIHWCNILIENVDAKEHSKEYANRILGYCAYEGTGMNKSLDDAIRYWKQGVQFKGGSCALSLARIYAKEFRDSVESINWYKKSAELENKNAAYFLAQLYEAGYILGANGEKIYYPNVLKDLSNAAKYYDVYIKNMGYSWSGVPTNSKLLYKLAQWHYFNGPCEDYLRLADLYLLSNYKVNQAYNIYKERYDAIEANADNDLNDNTWFDWIVCGLGKCYYKGAGVNQSYEKAVKYFKIAADNNDPEAMQLLSRCYRFGRGVSRSTSMAESLMKKATEMDDPTALRIRTLLE